MFSIQQINLINKLYDVNEIIIQNEELIQQSQLNDLNKNTNMNINLITDPLTFDSKINNDHDVQMPNSNSDDQSSPNKIIDLKKKETISSKFKKFKTVKEPIRDTLK